MSWMADMPSNIALIKYMGKTDSSVNLPTNPSISYTLNHLLTRVELTEIDSQDHWLPLNSGDFVAPTLSLQGHLGMAIAYMISSLVGCLIAVAVGYSIAKMLI